MFALQPFLVGKGINKLMKASNFNEASFKDLNPYLWKFITFGIIKQIA